MGDPGNWGRINDSVIGDLYSQQTQAVDAAERRSAIIELQKRLLDNAYYLPGLWWTRRVVHWTKVKNYVAAPNHYSNQKL